MASSRPLARLVRHSENEAVDPQFTESFLNSVSGSCVDGVLTTSVSYSLDSRGLIVSRRGCTALEKSSDTILARPLNCPFHDLQRQSLSTNHSSVANGDTSSSGGNTISQRGVAVAATVVLQSSDGAVLITQRAAHMRTYPLVWVVPGGHVEAGESFEEAALRELREETGLLLSAAEQATCHLLCLWESAYPALLSQGVPCRHHIVAYISVQCTSSSSTLLQQMTSCRDEVSAISWMPLSMFSHLLDKETETPSDICFRVHYLNNDSPSTEMRSLAALETPPPTGLEAWEHLSSGTEFAIQQLLKEIQHS